MFVPLMVKYNWLQPCKTDFHLDIKPAIACWFFCACLSVMQPLLTAFVAYCPVMLVLSSVGGDINRAAIPQGKNKQGKKYKYTRLKIHKAKKTEYL